MPRIIPALFLAAFLAACSHAPAPGDAATSVHATQQVWLLGETHDNAFGHAARAALLRKRIDAGWRPAIAMEQFDTGQQSALNAAMATCGDADCVLEKVAPEPASWDWPQYKPLIAMALQQRLPLRAANLSRAEASKVVKDGFAAALPAALIDRYQLDALPAGLLAAQSAEVRDGHCGMLPEPMLAPMAKAQIARDVVMAETMRPHAASGVVLIAGNGHVRSDIGVPYWLRKAGLAYRTEGFLEPSADATGFHMAHPIPSATRPDPCAAFQARPAKG